MGKSIITWSSLLGAVLTDVASGMYCRSIYRSGAKTDREARPSPPCIQFLHGGSHRYDDSWCWICDSSQVAISLWPNRQHGACLREAGAHGWHGLAACNSHVEIVMAVPSSGQSTRG